MFDTISEGINSFLQNTLSIDENIQKLMDYFYTLPELVKIGIIIGVVIVLVFGVFALIKKIIIELPKKIFFILVCIAVLYFVFAYVLR